MKAIFRWGTALVGLLLAAQISLGYVWVTPVFRCPYPVAPSPSNSGFYLVDAYGHVSGPHYYLVPPCKPFGGMLPGKTGEMIMSGYLPHTWLMSKEGLSIGKVPMLGAKAGPDEHAHGAPMPGAGLPDLNAQRMPAAYGNPSGGMPYGSPYGGMPYGSQHGGMPYGNPYGGAQYQGMQVPYPMPTFYGAPQAAMPMPMPMPYPGGPMPMPYPGGPMPMPYPGGPMPYPGGPMPMPAPAPRGPIAWRDGANNIWLAQNVTPSVPPFAPIPNFSLSPPTMPGMPGTPPMPSMPMMPGAPMGPMQTFPFFGPMQQFPPLNPLQGPQPPQMNAVPLQAPRMEMTPPPPQPPANAFPMHPFTRSPRDFFMWGENMEDEQRLRNRPFPVPR